MVHAVLHADAVPRGVQGHDAFPQRLPVFLQHGGGHHVEAVLQQLLLRGVAQQLQRGLVDADDVLSVQGVAHDAAVHGGEQGLQNLAFPDDFLLIGPLLGHVDGYAHRAHHGAVQIVQGGFIGGEQPLPLPGEDLFLRHAGLPFGHNLPLRLDAGGVVLLHVPDVGVAAALNLLLCLFDGAAEAVVHLLMDAVLILIPDQVGHAVDGGLQEMAGLPQVLFLLTALLPAQEAEVDLLREHRGGPNILKLGQEPGEQRQLGLTGDGDELGLGALGAEQRVQRGGGVVLQCAQVGPNRVGPGAQAGVRRCAAGKRVRKMLQWGHFLKLVQYTGFLAYQVELKLAMIH